MNRGVCQGKEGCEEEPPRRERCWFRVIEERLSGHPRFGVSLSSTRGYLSHVGLEHARRIVVGGQTVPCDTGLLRQRLTE